MIEYHYETNYTLSEESDYSDWISRIMQLMDFELGNLNYIFCDDDYLLQINQEYLNHDTYTDIITFDYSNEVEISGDVFISVERVKENSRTYKVTEVEEMKRVMAHGILHLLGYTDKSDQERAKMRELELELMRMFHVEQ